MNDLTDAKSRKTPVSRKTLVSITVGSAIAVLLIAIVTLLTGGRVTNADAPTSSLVGHHLNSFSLDGLFGGTIKAPWDSGRPSVEIFFASYCGPCQGDMPEIAKYLRTHNPGHVAILAVDSSDQRSAAKAMINKDDFTFPVAFDPNAVVTSGVFGFGYVPESVFVNANGVVTKVYFGAIPNQQLASGIKTLKASISS
jgi:thiol-disulfide isomerase/thioredoxin